MGRHEDRIALAQALGATDMMRERGEEAITWVRALTGGFGVRSVLECVGTDQAMETSMEVVCPGGAVDRVGLTHYETIPGAQHGRQMTAELENSAAAMDFAALLPIELTLARLYLSLRRGLYLG
jgi:threonine dehydrogenase-like Zn-dependent dehydrogenase